MTFVFDEVMEDGEATAAPEMTEATEEEAQEGEEGEAAAM